MAPAASDEDELHKKARRFAKLLVEEIKLYNQPRVEEGRQHKDLYDRLKVDIEKSRSTYDKRYAESPVASANYFTQELIRILADNDVSLMNGAMDDSVRMNRRQNQAELADDFIQFFRRTFFAAKLLQCYAFDAVPDEPERFSIALDAAQVGYAGHW